VDVIVASAKGKEGIERKTKDDYSGDKDKAAGKAGIQRMVDIVRGSVVVRGIEDLPTAYEAIKAAFTVGKDDVAEVVGLIKVKNNFAAMDKISNRDMNITVQLPKNKMFCEIQIHVKAFEANKNRKRDPNDKSNLEDDNDRKGWAFHGHLYYEASRIIKAEPGKQPDGVVEAIALLRHAEETDEMAERSDAAFKNLTPVETLMDQVDQAVRKIDLLPDESDREYHWARIFKSLLEEHQAKQNQSLMLAEVMKSDPLHGARKQANS
jgi:hypothetical protein